MNKLIGAALAAAFALALPAAGRAADADPNAVLDKAIQALGGQDKLSKAKALTWAVKGTVTFGDMDTPYTGKVAINGLDQYRQEFEADFGGNPFKAVTVLAGNKGWRKFGDDKQDLDADAIANEKRTIYLTVVPITILAAKGKEFKLAAAGEEQVGGKPAVGVKITGPDGKDFTVFFDKESGLPVKQVAKVIGFMGEEFTQETTFGDYKDMAGIKKATKISLKRDGEKFIEQTITGLETPDKLDDKTFAEPK